MKKANKRLKIKAPFFYFGGKSMIAELVWKLLGKDIKRYFEPFAGSLAVLFAREKDTNTLYSEIVNDLDCLLINVWKALKYASHEVALLCCDPSSQLLYWQRICYIIKHKDFLLERMLKDDEYYDIKLAAYWIYCKSSEIGAVAIDKTDINDIYNSIDNGITRGRIQLLRSNGIHSKCTHLYNPYSVTRCKLERLTLWFSQIQSVLENVKITCLDWKRLFNEGSHWQDDNSSSNIGIFFDPPYGDIERRKSLYRIDSYSVAKEVNDFCVKNAYKKTYRIVIAGYEGEHNNLENYGYTKYYWKAQGGYGNINSNYKNKNKERLWASYSCNVIRQS
ncbi:DNA adenine methylase [Brachyspira aalborgi]|uniref:DNA adenine methylase n=1 Tax=Brachyspira aalborgi TaxID=29522 RepID=UPI0026670FD7|nr:DNA adenine methylase [Brachyspira aalborgi]